jgi:hypothetical protein
MCDALFRESDGELTTRPLGCSTDADELYRRAQERLWLKRELVAVQPCLLALSTAIRAVHPGHSVRV